MELQFWCSTTVLNADYDDEAEAWTVLLDREGTETTLRPTHLIFATGMSGKIVILSRFACCPSR